MKYSLSIRIAVAVISSFGVPVGVAETLHLNALDILGPPCYHSLLHVLFSIMSLIKSDKGRAAISAAFAVRFVILWIAKRPAPEARELLAALALLLAFVLLIAMEETNAFGPLNQCTLASGS